jgi:hypothetical protein
MKLRNYQIALTCLFCLIFFSSCVPTSENFKLGEDMAKAKRWEEAVLYFEKALSDNPDSQE